MTVSFHHRRFHFRSYPFFSLGPIKPQHSLVNVGACSTAVARNDVEGARVVSAQQRARVLPKPRSPQRLLSVDESRVVFAILDVDRPFVVACHGNQAAPLLG